MIINRNTTQYPRRSVSNLQLRATLILGSCIGLTGCANSSDPNGLSNQTEAVAETESAITIPMSCLTNCDATCDQQAIAAIDTLAAQAPLPNPTSPHYRAGCTYFRHYANGDIFLRADIGAFADHGAIHLKYEEMNTIWSWLGLPITNESVYKTTWYNKFEHGYIFSDPSYGTYAAKYWIDGRTLYDINVPTGNGVNALDIRGKVFSGWNAFNSIDPFRANVVDSALGEVFMAFTGERAKSRYNGGSKWCSEFVRYVYQHSGVWMDYCQVDSPFGCIHHKTVDDATTVGDWYDLFAAYGRLYYVDGSDVEPGDYLAMNNASHSAIAVAVSPDRRWLWIAEGNVHVDGNPDGTTWFDKVDYVLPDGSINPNLTAVGKIDSSLKR